MYFKVAKVKIYDFKKKKNKKPYSGEYVDETESRLK